MFNPDLSIFNDNMFNQLRAHLAGLSAPEGLDEINLTIGEPQMPAPSMIAEVIASHGDKWQRYPKADGNPAFLDDVMHYISYRFGQNVADIMRADKHIVPVVGTREPLHLLGQMVRGAKPDSIAFLPNPYYHAWRAGALGAGGEICFMPTSAETGFLPDLDLLDEDRLKRTNILYICTPSNPHGSFASKAYLQRLIRLARRYNFLLACDECYIDVWRGEPPLSALQVAAEMGDGLSHLVVLNSLSKRSNAAGLRAGFLAGDEAAITLYKKFVANGAALVPVPLLNAAGALYRDAEHAEIIRQHYETSFEIAKSYFDFTVPQGGFFIWLPVGDDLAFVKQAYSAQALRIMPGQFMAKTTDEGSALHNVGKGYVRIALVHDHNIVKIACQRLASLLDKAPSHEIGKG